MDIRSLRIIFLNTGKKENIVGNVASLCIVSTTPGKGEIHIVQRMEPCRSIVISCQTRSLYLKTIGEIPDSGAVAVSVTYYNDFVTSIY